MVSSPAPRTPWLVRVIAVAAVVATAVLVPPYLTLDQDASRIDVAREPLWWLLVVHVLAAATAMLLGVLQLVPRIRRRREVHRRIGRTFLVVGVAAFVGTGIPLALTTPHGAVTRYGVLIPALLWPLLAVAGWRAIRRRDVEAHRAWMLRLFAVTFFAVSARLIVPVLLLLQLPVMGAWYDGDVERAVEASIPVGQWLGWIVNLAIAEAVIRRTRTPVSPRGGSRDVAFAPD